MVDDIIISVKLSDSEVALCREVVRFVVDQKSFKGRKLVAATHRLRSKLEKKEAGSLVQLDSIEASLLIMFLDAALGVDLLKNSDLGDQAIRLVQRIRRSLTPAVGATLARELSPTELNRLEKVLSKIDSERAE